MQPVFYLFIVGPGQTPGVGTIVSGNNFIYGTCYFNETGSNVRGRVDIRQLVSPQKRLFKNEILIFIILSRNCLYLIWISFSNYREQAVDLVRCVFRLSVYPQAWWVTPNMEFTCMSTEILEEDAMPLDPTTIQIHFLFMGLQTTLERKFS